METWNTRTYVEQNATLLSSTHPTMNIPWTAPASGTGSVVFYTGGCVVNNNLLPTGDNAATSSLTITESAGCVPATISTTPADVTCYGYADGNIDYSATGGTGAIGYSWTGPGGFASSTSGAASLTGLGPGTYTLVVTSTGGCTDTTTVTINQPPAITATITADTPVCPGANLTFTVTATGGSGGSGSYTYSWTGPNSFSSPLQDPVVYGFTAVDSGVYTLIVTDVLGCSGSATIDAGLAPVPVISLGPDTTICFFDSIVIGTAFAGDTYLWSTGATTPTIAVHGSAGTATYFVTVTNSAGCSSSDTIHISVNPCEGGVKNVVTSSGMEMYPNPAGDVITIRNNAKHILQRISIYNAYGQKVFDQQPGPRVSEQEIDISRFSAGLYFVRLLSDEEEVTEKLEIVR